jgi:hypothetical protein
MTCLGFNARTNRPRSASSYGILGRAETVATRRTATGSWPCSRAAARLSGKMVDEPAARRRCRPGSRAPHRSHEPRDCEVAIVSEHAQPLFGREPDIDDLHAFVDEALTKGGACVLHGDAGVGKTRLLTLCSEVATDGGARVLSASGVQFEACLSFGVLHQLLRPILTEVEALDASSAAALRSALDLGAGAGTTDPVAVCTAALSLLVLAARQGPVLLVVDDLQWLDTSTASVLAFIARRLAGYRIGFVGALRLGEAARFDSQVARCFLHGGYWREGARLRRVRRDGSVGPGHQRRSSHVRPGPALTRAVPAGWLRRRSAPWLRRCPAPGFPQCRPSPPGAEVQRGSG